MTQTAGKSTYTAVTGTNGKRVATRTTGELLVVAKEASCDYTEITNPLTRNNINLECFTTYKWGEETAFRMVTSDNGRACEILRCAGFEVQESPVTLWYTRNEPGRFNKAADALSRANIETYCTYSTVAPNSNTMIIAFNTNDTGKTGEVLSKIH